MKGPILHSSKVEYVGVVYPWHVFKPTREGVPERMYYALATLIDDETGERKIYKPMLPLSEFKKKYR